MAPIHGTNSRAYFCVEDVSGLLHTATLSGTGDTSESTTFGAAAKTYVVGQRDRVFSAEGYIDSGSEYIDSLLGSAAGILTYCPGGASAIGDLAWLSNVINTTFTPSAEVAGTSAFAWDAQTSGLTAFGYVLHPFGEDTNNTTGATRDDTGSTSTGWTGHLHVSVVDGGSWVVKLQDASASNFSDVADVTGGSFTAATGATYQRLQSAAGATLRRYVRYVATRTGGSAGDGITFLLALSRTRAD